MERQTGRNTSQAHSLVSITTPFMALILTFYRSEKHSMKEQALERLKAGENFHTVALDFAEHKRKEGKSCTIVPMGSQY